MSSFMVRWLKLSLVAVVGCGFLAMMLYALLNRDEISASNIEPPLISPPAEPLKRRPDQPGGMQIPNRDKLVFDLLDSSNTVLGDTGMGMRVEISATPAGEGTAGVMPGQAISDTAVPVQAVGINTLLATTAQPARPVTLAAVPVMPAPVKVEVKVAPQAEVVAAKTAPTVEPKATAKMESKPELKAEPKAETKATGGKWAVQLAAVNTLADGNALASKASKDFSALRSLTPRVSPVPKVNKFRVQFTGLKDRDAAAAVCAKLTGRQPCFPVILP